jgi:membrane protein required for colicin V production
MDGGNRSTSLLSAEEAHDKTGDGAVAPGYTRGGLRVRPGGLGFAGIMSITLLDIVLIIVMLISGLLAMVRGFMREILSITAWVLAAAVTLYAYAKLLPYARQYFNSDLIAAIAVVGGVFLGTLLVVSVLTIRVSDMVLDSRVGALDRTLGFLFGLGRGLIIVVVAFQFFTWLVPDHSQPQWVRNAKSRVVLSGTGQWLMSMLPENAEATILNKLKLRRPAENGTPKAPSDQHSQIEQPASHAANGADSGYDRTDRTAMQRLIEARGIGH